MGNKQCFVISPIGEEGSDIRKCANDLFDLILVPALEKYDFDVMRADLIPKPAVITSDIIKLVQSSDLCIIDLTGSNPNVFYECGRRHETGKPFIQMIKKGEKLPFDVAGIRTITYDLSDPRIVRETQLTIQTYVAELEKSGFTVSTSGESLTSIASSLERIERRINLIGNDASFSLQKDKSETELLEQLRIKANPKKAFFKAMDQDDLFKAREILPFLKESLGNTQDLLYAAAIFAASGDEYSLNIIKEILINPKGDLPDDAIESGIITVSKYYDLIDEDRQGADFLKPIVEKYCQDDKIKNETKAYILNSVQLRYYTAECYEEALNMANEVINYDPNDAAYHYNSSLILIELKKYNDAIKSFETYLSLVDPKKIASRHLKHGIELYFAIKNEEKASELYSKMIAIDEQFAKNMLKKNKEMAAFLSVSI